MLFSGKENIFRCLVAFQNIFWKIFFGVWLYSWKCSEKTNFIMFLTFSCIFSASKQIYHNSNKIQIHQNPNSQYPTKKISSNQRSVRVREQQNKNHPRHQRRIDPEQADRRFGGTILGLTNGASRVRDDRWRMGLMMDELDDLRNGFDGRDRRSEEWVRRTSSTIWGMGSTDELDDLRNGFAIWRFGHCSTNELGLGFSGFVGALGCESISPSPVLVRSLFSAVSLSLFYFPGAEVIWSENENGNYFPPLFTLFYGQTEIIFSLTEFSVAAKHPIFRKIISGISLKSIQTQP